MRRNLGAYIACQVFLNHPFDDAFQSLAEAMSFAVVAGGLLPVSALDLTASDQPRLEMLVDAIRSCHYSVHDLSRSSGEGPQNFARMNMPIEMGMALFHALSTQRRDHRSLFLVSTPHDYKSFASDLAGLDAHVHEGDERHMLTATYAWPRSVVPSPLFNVQPTVAVIERFVEFKKRAARIRGSNGGGKPSHDETREVMYQTCAEIGWWDWRNHRMGKDEFPIVPVSFNE